MKQDRLNNCQVMYCHNSITDTLDIEDCLHCANEQCKGYFENKRVWLRVENKPPLRFKRLRRLCCMNQSCHLSHSNMDISCTEKPFLTSVIRFRRCESFLNGILYQHSIHDVPTSGSDKTLGSASYPDVSLLMKMCAHRKANPH